MRSGSRKAQGRISMLFDDTTYIRIDRNIQGLRNNPFPKGVAKLRGGGNRYRIREGKYRMLYEIDEKNKKEKF